MNITEAKRKADEHMKFLGYKHSNTYFTNAQDSFFMAACVNANVDTSDNEFTEDEVKRVARHMADDQERIDEIERLSWEITAETIEKGINRDPLVVEWIIDEVARTFLDRHNNDSDSQNILPRDMRPEFYYLAADLEILIVKERHETISPWKERNYVWPVEARQHMLDGLLDKYEAEYSRVRNIRDDERLSILRTIARLLDEPVPDAIPQDEKRTQGQLKKAMREARREHDRRKRETYEERERERLERRADAEQRNARAVAKRLAQEAAEKAAQKEREKAHASAEALKFAELIEGHVKYHFAGSDDIDGDIRRLLKMGLAAGGAQAEGCRIYAQKHGIKI